MKKKHSIALVSLLTIGLLVILKQNYSKEYSQNIFQNLVAQVSGTTKNYAIETGEEAPKQSIVSSQAIQKFEKLNAEELEEYKVNVRENFRKAKDWQKWNEADKIRFETTMRKLGNRASQHEVDLLKNVSGKENIDGNKASEIVLSLDTVQSFAKMGDALSQQALLEFASEHIPTFVSNEKLQIADPVRSTLVFESLVALATVRPEAALQIVKNVRNHSLEKVYIYQYYVGRKTSGIGQAKAKEELKAEFGPKILEELGV
jgi:hypothetical protein